MNKLQTESISTFRNNYNAALAKLAEGPVLLLQNSNLAAVLVSPEEWNALIERIEDAEDQVAAWRDQYEVATGKAKTKRFNPADYEEQVLVLSGD